MLGRLLFLFIVVPLVELVLLLQVGQWIGVLPTLGLVVTTGVCGAALARRQGLNTFMAVQGELAEGRLPARALLDGLAILIGGALLLTPGILTDALGLALLFPLTRQWIRSSVRRSLERRIREGTVDVRIFHPGGVILTRTGEVRSGEPPAEGRDDRRPL